MKICILTQPLRNNYGGILQAFALQKVLRDMGHEVVTDRGTKVYHSLSWRAIRFSYHFVRGYILRDKRYNPFQFMLNRLDKIGQTEKRRNSEITGFIDKYILTTEVFAKKNSIEELEKYEAIVVGSDQVWRKAYSNVEKYFLWPLQNNSSIIKVAYAASFGKDDIGEYSSRDLLRCRIGAKTFKAVSVREGSGIRICRDYFGVQAQHVLDPTLLLDASDYEKLIPERLKCCDEKYIFFYILDSDPAKNEIIRNLSKGLNLKSKIVGLDGNAKNNVLPSIEEWLSYIRNAEYIVTDSFHGIVFSIIFKKQFIAICNKNRGASRFHSLLKDFGLEDRLIDSSDKICEEHIKYTIDYILVDRQKKICQEKSMNFIEINL